VARGDHLHHPRSAGGQSGYLRGMKSKLLTDSPRTFALVLEPGEEAVSTIEAWAKQEGVTPASLTAIGGFEASVLGFFDWDVKEYTRIPVNQQVEVVSLIGDIALAEGSAKLHAHAVLGCRDGSARAAYRRRPLLTRRGGRSRSPPRRPHLREPEQHVAQPPLHLPGADPVALATGAARLKQRFRSPVSGAYRMGAISTGGCGARFT
jgi:Predicted DNA-binding protein with PD1-like DNA-binding motif